MSNAKPKVRAALVVLAIACLAFWLMRGPRDCKQAAQPMIDALERFHRTHGRYPDSLDKLVGEKLLRAIPETTWNWGVRHPFDFEYFVEPDLDFYCLGYAEYTLPLDDDGKLVSYVSFRHRWDDDASVRRTKWEWLPVDRAGEVFRATRSSADLRLLIKKVLEWRDRGGRNNPLPIYWVDIANAIGEVTPCTMDDRDGVCVEAADKEGASFGLVTKSVSSPQYGDTKEVIVVLELERAVKGPRWRELYRK